MGVWYENFDYDRNPFVVRPDESSFVGFRDIVKKVAESIASEDVIIVKGGIGSGKTTFLKYLYSKMKDPLTPVYYNAIEERFDIHKLTERDKSFVDALFHLEKQKAKNIILLVDEAHKLKPHEIERIKAGYDSGLFRALVIGTSRPIEELPRSLVDRATTVIEIRPMTTEEAWAMIEKRLNGLPNPFHRDSIATIVAYSKGNPRRILKTCAQVLREISTRYPEIPTYILPEHVSDVLGISVKEEKEKTSEYVQPESEVKEIRRVPDEDIDLGNELLNALSPLQKRIILALKDNEMTYDELEAATGTSRATLAKQVSRLCMASDPEILKKKGINRPLLEKVGTNGSTKIKLTEYAKSLLEPVEIVDDTSVEIVPDLDLSKITIV